MVNCISANANRPIPVKNPVYTTAYPYSIDTE